MRILHLSSLWPPTVLGGAERYASRLADEQGAAGHEVGAVTLGVSGPGVIAAASSWPYGLDEWAGQPAWKRVIHHARDVYDPLTGRTVVEAIRRFRPDVVHSHGVAGMSAAALTAPGRTRTPHVHTIHDYWLLCQRTTLVAADDRACTARCTGCRVVSGLRTRIGERRPPQLALAVSEAVADEHRRAGVFADRLRVIRHPVEVVATRVPRRLPTSPIVFGFLGQLLAIKGVRTLLEAFRRLPEGTAELVVAGRGPLADDVAGAGAGVTALGWVEGGAFDAFFDRIDALVVPSEWKEPAGLVVNEARARQVPVIAASIGGIPELVAPEHRDLLFRSGDVADLVAKLRLFGADPARFAAAEPPKQGWAEHASEVAGAYDDAAALLRRDRSVR